MRTDGGSGRPKRTKRAPSKGNKKAAALLQDIADAATSKLGSPAPARRVQNFDRALAKPKPKVRVLENERAKGESKVKTRVVENERAKSAPKLRPRVVENERGKAEPKVDIKNLRVLLDKKQPENRRADALSQLQKSTNKTYRLPDDSVLKSIATGKPVERPKPKPVKKADKGSSLLDKLSWINPVTGPPRVVGKFGGKALDAAVPVVGKAIVRTVQDDLKALGAVKTVADKLIPDGRTSASGEVQSAGVQLPPGAKRAIREGTLAAGSAAIKGLSAPLSATESAVGKGLVEAGIINGESERKIRAAPGPIKAFKKTLKKGITPDQVHGSDITKGLGLGKQAGIVADLALDPLMISGVGLAPATGGTSLAVAVARAENRLRVLAPQVFHGDEIQGALRTLRNGGDQAAFLKVVEQVAPKEALDAARVELAQASVKKALDNRDARKEQMAVRPRRKLRQVVRGKDADIEIQDVVPPPVGTDAVAAAIRAGKSRETSSTLGFQFRTPTGRAADINVSIAGKKIINQGNIPLLPVGKLPLYTSKKSYLRELGRERSAKLATIDGEAQAKLTKLAADRARIQYSGTGRPEDLSALDMLEDSIKKEAHLKKQKGGLLAGQEYTPDVPRSLFTSVAQRVNDRNVRLAQVDGGRVLAADVGRMTGKQFEQLYEKALSPIKPIKDAALRSVSAQRAQLYREMMASSDGALQDIADDLLQLTPEEKLVANNLSVVNKMELEHAQDVGLMHNGWEGYAGQRIWLGANDPLNPQQQIDKMVGRPIPSSGSTTAALKQRSAQSLFDVADPDQLAGILQTLSRKELDPTEYRVMADKLHEAGTARRIHTQHVRYLQRGNLMPIDRLTDVETRTMTRDASLVPDGDVPLWRPLDDPGAEGYLLPLHFEQHGLEMNPYAPMDAVDGERAQVMRLADAILDRRDWREQLQRNPDNAEALAWVQRLDDEIHKLDPAPAVDIFDPVATYAARDAAGDLADSYKATVKGRVEQLAHEQAQAAAIRASLDSRFVAPPEGVETVGDGIQYHGAGSEIVPAPEYLDQNNLYGSYEMLYTTDDFHTADSYARDKNRGDITYRVDFMGREFTDDLESLFTDLLSAEARRSDLEDIHIATSDGLVTEVNEFTRLNGRQPSDAEYDALYQQSGLAEAFHNLKAAEDDLVLAKANYNDQRKLVNFQRKDLDPVEPKLAELDTWEQHGEEWIKYFDAQLGPGNAVSRYLEQEAYDYPIRLGNMVETMSWSGDNDAYKQLVQALWDDGYDGWVHAGGQRRADARHEHKVIIYFKAHRTLRMIPMAPAPESANLRQMQRSLEDLEKHIEQLYDDAQNLEIQTARARPNQDGFDTIILDKLGGAWIGDPVRSGGEMPELPILSPDGRGVGDPGPFGDVLARSQQLRADDPLDALIDGVDQATEELIHARRVMTSERYRALESDLTSRREAREILSKSTIKDLGNGEAVMLDAAGGEFGYVRRAKGGPDDLMEVKVPVWDPKLGEFDEVKQEMYEVELELAFKGTDGFEILTQQQKLVFRRIDDSISRLDAQVSAYRRDLEQALENADEANPLSKLRGTAPQRTKLPDFRSGQAGYGDYRRDSGLTPELHPRVVGHVRSRATGIATANQIRYDAITQVVGRNSDESKATWTDLETGETGPAADISPMMNPDGELDGYVNKVTGMDYEIGEIEFNGPALLTTSDRAGEYWDAVTGQRYRHPHLAFGNTLMGQNIRESTLWPVQYIDDLAYSSQKAGEYDQVFDTALQSLNQQILSTLRFGVTVPFPAYHIRNMASDLVKSLQADSGVLFHPWVNSKLAGAAFGKGLDRTVPVPGFGDMPLPDFLLMADMFGVRTGGQVNDFMEAFSTGAITEQKVAGMLKRTGGRLSELSAEREDVVRYMTFLQRMRRNGGDPAEAAFYMTRHHFNYNDLSQVERRTMRNIFLFYTWFRKNIPLQLVELGRRPGFFAAAFTTYRDIEAGDTPINFGPFAGPAPFQAGLPDYVKDRMQSFSLPWKDTVVNIGWGAPWSDLGLLATGDHGEDLFNTVSSMLNPIVSSGLQIATKREPMTGRTYEDDEATGQTAVIDNVMRLFGSDGLMRNEDDKPTLPWQAAVALRNLPFLGRATASAGATPATRDSGRLQQYSSSLTGLTGLNMFVYPPKGGDREKKLIDGYLKGKVAERRDLLSAIDKLKDSKDKRAREAYVERLAKLDKELLQDAAERGISKQLKKTDNAGYKSKKKRRSSGGLGGGLGGGLSGGGLK